MLDVTLFNKFEAKHSTFIDMKKIILLSVAGVATLSLTNCIGLAVKGADEGSQAMSKNDNEVISGTGDTIQKGVQPINEAKDGVVDAVKGAFD